MTTNDNVLRILDDGAIRCAQCWKTFSTRSDFDFHNTRWWGKADVWNGYKESIPDYITCYQQRLVRYTGYCCLSDDPNNLPYACRDNHMGCVQRLLQNAKSENLLRGFLPYAILGGKDIYDTVVGRMKELRNPPKPSQYELFKQRLKELGYVPDHTALRQMTTRSFCMPENCTDTELVRTADFLCPLYKTR